MTTPTIDPLRATINGAVALSILRQLRPEVYSEVTADNLLENQPVFASFIEDVGHLRVSPLVITEDAIEALMRFLLNPDHAGQMLTSLARVLWMILGDGSDDDPPAIYKKAAVAMHMFMVSMIEPDYPHKFKDLYDDNV